MKNAQYVPDENDLNEEVVFFFFFFVPKKLVFMQRFTSYSLFLIHAFGFLSVAGFV